MSIVSQFLPDGHPDKIVSNSTELNVLPSEGSFYGTRWQLDTFADFLLSRPNNRPCGKVTKSESIGIGWDKTSCWWLKSKYSNRIKYNYVELKKFINMPLKEEFVLPEKWCIKLTEENVETLGKWRTDGILKDPRYVKEGFYLHTPMSGRKGYNEPSKHPDYTEITFEQFKQHVLKKSPVLETPKEENYVGRTIKALVNHPESTNVKKGEIIKIKEINDYNQFYTLEKSKAGTEGMVIVKPLNLSNWELISEDNIDMQDIQEEARKRFPIGCKFIPVGGHNTYKLLEDGYTYSIHNKHIWAHLDHGSLYADGQWATFIPEYVECVRGLNNAKVGKIYKVINDTRCESDNPTVTYSWQTIDYKPSTKEAYEAQFKQKQLRKEDLVEGEIYIYDGLHISTYPEGPSLTIKENFYEPNPNWLWILSITHATEEQKALLRSEIEKNNTKTPISEEYVPQVGDYVVMEKAGGWSYDFDNNGCIAIVEKVSTRKIGYSSESITVPSIGGQVINPKKLDNIIFTNVPMIGFNKERVFRKALPHEIPSDLPKSTVIKEWSEGTYAVGVKGNFGVYEGSENPISIGHIYTIKENRTNNLAVEGKAFWIYKENLKWFATREEAETFSKGLRTGHITIDSCEKLKSENSKWPSDPIVEERINTPSIEKETFIKDVQSISVMLRTKRKSIKF